MSMTITAVSDGAKVMGSGLVGREKRGELDIGDEPARLKKTLQGANPPAVKRHLLHYKRLRQCEPNVPGSEEDGGGRPRQDTAKPLQ